MTKQEYKEEREKEKKKCINKSGFHKAHKCGSKHGTFFSNSPSGIDMLEGKDEGVTMTKTDDILDNQKHFASLKEGEDKWTRQVGNLKVRAYEIDTKSLYHKGVLLKLSKGINFAVYESLNKECENEIYIFIEGECHEFFRIPIMPYSESKGKFECPK